MTRRSPAPYYKCSNGRMAIKGPGCCWRSHISIVSCVNVCVCGVYIVSDCVLDERLCTVWCMCSINSICVL